MSTGQPSSKLGALLEVERESLAAALAHPGAVTLQLARGEHGAAFELDRPALERLLSSSHGDSVRIAIEPQVIDESGILQVGDVEAHSLRGLLGAGAVAATLVIGGLGAHDALADRSAPHQGIPPHVCTPTFCYIGKGIPSSVRPTGHLEFLPARVTPAQPDQV